MVSDSLSSEESLAYEIIASLPIDYERVDLLKDITFEAQILIRSKFVKKIVLKHEDFKRLHEHSEGKDVLLTTELLGNRFIIYIEKGKIVSTAMSSLEGVERVVGLRPLATLISISRERPITFKLFEVREIEDYRAREELARTSAESALAQALRAREDATAKPVEEGRPPAVVFAEKLNEFRARAERMLIETVPAYGCKLMDYKMSVSKGVIAINLLVKRSSFISKCRVDKLKNLLKNDLELVLAMLDIDLSLVINVELLD